MIKFLIGAVAYVIFALIYPDIAWPLFTAALIVTEAVVVLVFAVWVLMCWGDWRLLLPSQGRG